VPDTIEEQERGGNADGAERRVNRTAWSTGIDGSAVPWITRQGGSSGDTCHNGLARNAASRTSGSGPPTSRLAGDLGRS
jgi:hypothetical protein